MLLGLVLPCCGGTSRGEAEGQAGGGGSSAGAGQGGKASGDAGKGSGASSGGLQCNAVPSCSAVERPFDVGGCMGGWFCREVTVCGTTILCGTMLGDLTDGGAGGAGGAGGVDSAAGAGGAIECPPGFVVCGPGDSLCFQTLPDSDNDGCCGCLMP